MARTVETRRAGKFEDLRSGAARANGDIASANRDRRNGSHSSTSGIDRELTRAKGIGKLTLVPIDSLKPDPRNPRKHSRVQVRAIARSIEAFGFNAPILVDKHNQIVAGHGRYEAAQLLGFDKIPVIRLDHLTEAREWDSPQGEHS